MCELCLRRFPDVPGGDEAYDQHVQRCSRLCRQFEKMPKQEVLKFVGFNKMTAHECFVRNLSYAMIDADLYMKQPSSGAV